MADKRTADPDPPGSLHPQPVLAVVAGTASSWRWRGRIALTGAILLLVTPAVVGVATYSTEPVAENTTDVDDITFVGVQGTFGSRGDGRVVAIDTTSREIVWEYSNASAGENVAYYDVDPLSEDTILVVEEADGIEPWSASALIIDWREDEVVDRFPVQSDTHDVDHVRGDRYVVADKFEHRAYVYDAGTEEIVWEFDFAEHFPEYPAAGNAPSTEPSGSGGYTHLNDVDVVANGSAFLLSPRNFDRVVLVDRSTKAVEWVLGGQDDHAVLHEQHNPDLLALDPPVVLVADSENDRVVEIDPADDSRVWRYAGGTDPLQWPRDADRLPNGHTMIVDSRNFRVLQINRSSEVVWEHDLAGDRGIVYDADRVGLPEEPGDVPSGQQLSDGGGASPLTDVRATIESWAGFVVPPWMGLGEIGIALVGLAAGVVLLVDGGHVYLRNRE